MYENIVIFESPDNGKTVYKRDFLDYSTRELVIIDGKKIVDMTYEEIFKYRVKLQNL